MKFKIAFFQKNRLLFFCFIILLAGNRSYGQDPIQVSGTITDSLGKALRLKYFKEVNHYSADSAGGYSKGEIAEV